MNLPAGRPDLEAVYIQKREAGTQFAYDNVPVRVDIAHVSFEYAIAAFKDLFRSDDAALREFRRQQAALP